ncbi:MAG: acyl-CoA dehydrogenase family protein [Candidatus Nezhaarchaeales archaeon]
MDFELTKEQKEVQAAAREFAQKEFKPELAREYDRREEFPYELFRKAASLGFIGCHFPEEYGGQGYGLLETCLIIEEFCRADSTLGVAVILGAFGSDLIHMFGSEEQKEKYLVKVARGEWISSGAFTEPAHGSDITVLDTTAKRDGDYYVINGTKTLISNAPIADFAVVLCQSEPGVRYKQTLLIVDKGCEGFEASKIEGKMGIRASPIGEYSFNNVRVSIENLVGTEGMGFYHTLEFLDLGRVGVAAQAVGMAQGALDRALRYAKERSQFNRKIADFQVIQHKLADMAIQIEAARLLTYKAAWYVDKGRIIPELTSMAKTYATEMAIRVIDEALQIFGGYGYIAEYDVERYYRDVRITPLYEGTSEIQRNVIAKALLR